MKVMARRIDNQDSLDPRTRQLLRALIGRYIRDGQPVGSQTLARHAGLDVSPATIRNILSDLEEIGLLAAPHTSAGRIPTARGLDRKSTRLHSTNLCAPRKPYSSCTNNQR